MHVWLVCAKREQASSRPIFSTTGPYAFSVMSMYTSHTLDTWRGAWRLAWGRIRRVARGLRLHTRHSDRAEGGGAAGAAGRGLAVARRGAPAAARYNDAHEINSNKSLRTGSSGVAPAHKIAPTSMHVISVPAPRRHRRQQRPGTAPRPQAQPRQSAGSPLRRRVARVAQTRASRLPSRAGAGGRCAAVGRRRTRSTARASPRCARRRRAR